jgi:RHS repeat-associated protein
MRHNYTYQAFGTLEEAIGRTENQYLFAGENLDKESEEYVLRQRLYNTKAGRFSRSDTYEGRLGEPLTLNKYIYTHDNPVNLTDPTGMFILGEFAAANGIRSILSEINFDAGSRFLATTGGGGSFEDDLLRDLAVAVAIPVIGAFVTFLAKASKAAIAQGGWLVKHEEGLGGIGHTIGKHVDVDDASLLERLSETRANGRLRYGEATRFANIRSAEKGVKEAILTNKEAIRSWRRSPSASPRLAVDYSGDGTMIGYGMRQGDSVSSPRYGTRVVLQKKNPSDPNSGFTIVTAHPL